MRTLLSFIAFSLVAVSAVVGCGGATDDASDDSADVVSASDRILVGDYDVHGTTNATGFATLTLKANHTYTAEASCGPAAAGEVATCHAIRVFAGSWKVTKSGPQLGRPQGAPLLVLTDELGTATDYFYDLKSDELSLSTSIVDPHTTLFAKDLSSLPTLKANDTCTDAKDNTLGVCPVSTACTKQNGVASCLPTR